MKKTVDVPSPKNASFLSGLNKSPAETTSKRTVMAKAPSFLSSLKKSPADTSKQAATAKTSSFLSGLKSPKDNIASGKGIGGMGSPKSGSPVVGFGGSPKMKGVDSSSTFPFGKGLVSGEKDSGENKAVVGLGGLKFKEEKSATTPYFLSQLQSDSTPKSSVEEAEIEAEADKDTRIGDKEATGMNDDVDNDQGYREVVRSSSGSFRASLQPPPPPMEDQFSKKLGEGASLGPMAFSPPRTKASDVSKMPVIIDAEIDSGETARIDCGDEDRDEVEPPELKGRRPLPQSNRPINLWGGESFSGRVSSRSYGLGSSSPNPAVRSKIPEPSLPSGDGNDDGGKIVAQSSPLSGGASNVADELKLQEQRSKASEEARSAEESRVAAANAEADRKLEEAVKIAAIAKAEADRKIKLLEEQMKARLAEEANLERKRNESMEANFLRIREEHDLEMRCLREQITNDLRAEADKQRADEVARTRQQMEAEHVAEMKRLRDDLLEVSKSSQAKQLEQIRESHEQDINVSLLSICAIVCFHYTEDVNTNPQQHTLIVNYSGYVLNYRHRLQSLLRQRLLRSHRVKNLNWIN